MKNYNNSFGSSIPIPDNSKKENLKKITIMIADDHQLVREAWSYILNMQADFEVIANCGDAEEAVEVAKNKRPNIILMDLRMPPFSGIEATVAGIDATEKIRKFSPGSKIIGLSMHAEPAFVKRMLQKGARGYVTKNSSHVEMFKAIQEVYKGNRFICQEVRNNILINELDEEMDGTELDKLKIRVNKLTSREIEVIRYIAQGASSKEIATALKIGIKTVEVHRHNILKKLNLKNAAALVNFIHTYTELIHFQGH